VRARRALLLASALSLACARVPAQHAPSVSPTAAMLMRALAERSARLQGLKAYGRATVDSPRGSGTSGFQVAAQRPGSLRLEVDGFFNNAVAILASDGKQMELARLDKGTFARGPASPENIGILFPMVWPPEAAVGLLLADPPRLTPETTTVRMDEAHKAYALELSAPPQKQTFFFEAETLTLVGVTQAGFGPYEVWFDDREPLGDIEFPHRIDFHAPAAATAIQLRYRELELNPQLEPATFTLAPPAGAQIQELP
jgi:outer membrane lipoprotein-sorting protein